MQRWLPVVGVGVLIRAVLILGSISWVAFYSHVLNPGQQYDHYRAHAAVASPWIAILGGIPLVYLACRRLARTRPPIPTASLMFATCAALDIPMVAMSEGADSGLCTLGLFTTLVSGYLGARAGRPPALTATA